MSDKLRDEINRILFHVLSNEERADKIAELLAPELEKARKWDKLKEIAEYAQKDTDNCEPCPLNLTDCYGECDALLAIVKALEEI